MFQGILWEAPPHAGRAIVLRQHTATGADNQHRLARVAPFVCPRRQKTVSFAHETMDDKGMNIDGCRPLLPAGAFEAIERTARRLGARVYFAGGEVRDWLLGRQALDLDLTVSGGGLDFARHLAAVGGGTFVPLSPAEDLGRVAAKGWEADVSGFRGGAVTIEEDLWLRDFTVNALALALDGGGLIDPTGGCRDLRRKRLRMVRDGAFADDPLRVLRGWRFCAQLGFHIEERTLAAMRLHGADLRRCAGERLRMEFDKLMAAPAAAETVAAMAGLGTLGRLFPELERGAGLAQPSSHHLDVFGHCLETLRRMEEVIAAPGRFFSEAEPLRAYLALERHALLLKYAALLHDVGKPAVFAKRHGRLTFYGHDNEGARLFSAIAARLAWSRKDTDTVALLIKQHMRPFHLNNAGKKAALSAKACLKLTKDLGDHLPGLFLLAMADSLAGRGPGKPAGMEADIDRLFSDVMAIYRDRVEPVLKAPPLLNGHDIMRIYGLRPGPAIGRMLRALQAAQVEWPGMDRKGAVAWGWGYLERDCHGGPGRGPF